MLVACAHGVVLLAFDLSVNELRLANNPKCSDRRLNTSLGPAPTTFGGIKTPLASESFDVLPAKETGVERPGARTDHCQSGAKGRQQDGDQLIARTRKGYPDLDGCDERPNQWGPQTHEERYSRTGCDHLREYWRKLRP